MRLRIKEGEGPLSTFLPDGSCRSFAPREEFVVNDDDVALVAWAESFGPAEILEDAVPKASKASKVKATVPSEDASDVPSA
jgi:hypothetical protein